MFHFSGYCFFRAMYSLGDEPVLTGTGYPIRKSTGRGLFAAHRGLSQLITSFFACWHQGIHHVLLVAFLLRYLKFFCAFAWTGDSRGHLRRLSKLMKLYFIYFVCGCQRADPRLLRLEGFVPVRL